MTDQYITTEEQLKKLLSLQIKDWVGVAEEIRSHPYNPQAVREKVLDELEQWVKPEDNELDRTAKYKGDYIHASGRLLKKLEELRKQEQP